MPVSDTKYDWDHTGLPVDRVKTKTKKTKTNKDVPSVGTRSVMERLCSLTSRESDVARQIYLGQSNIEGAKALGIGPPTFATHLRRLFKKLDVHNRASVVRVMAELENKREGKGEDGGTR